MTYACVRIGRGPLTSAAVRPTVPPFPIPTCFYWGLVFIRCPVPELPIRPLGGPLTFTAPGCEASSAYFQFFFIRIYSLEPYTGAPLVYEGPLV
jgi:hypothetical protein